MIQSNKRIFKFSILFLTLFIFISAFYGCQKKESAEELYALGEKYFKEQDFYNTIETLNKVEENELEKDKEANRNYMTGYSYWQLKRFDTALIPLKKADELKPNNEDYMIALARVYDINDNFEKSEEYYLKVIEINEKNETAYMSLGNIYLKKDPPEIKKSIEYSKKAIDIYPDCANAYGNLAIAYDMMNDKEKTKQYLKKAKSLGYNNLPAIRDIKNK
ncbi:tetratricopeptide repeat protein [Anaerofustis stercorihominis]|uniref:tetratricopeptide repeat protein n=1 Tax=Anaerofustis stercorihominis TaxID=214853 RepID=UPI00214C7F4B|nr:hypothetical protein [Anaerofustis stercorihominis]MCR2032817.1 hypothetical protein [Anaerofustis stercorihominis]